MTKSINRFFYHASRHWLRYFNIIVGVYISLPLLAPILMNAGLQRPARVLYTMYSPMCHQMAFRSFFLFGEQSVYPRELAGSSFTSFETYSDDLSEFDGVDKNDWPTYFFTARQFLGNEQMGYKTALCERDMAIFGTLFVGGLAYAILRRKYQIKPMPFLLFLFLGMGPIGLDGFSQLFGYIGVNVGGDLTVVQRFFSSIFVLRESPPYLRTLTGAIFGLSVAWLTLPSLDEGMQATSDGLKKHLE